MHFEWPFGGTWKPTWPEKLPKRVAGGGVGPYFGLGRVLGEAWCLLGPPGAQDANLIDFSLIFDNIL